MAKKFAQKLTNREFETARAFEAAGLTTISQAVKAFEREEIEKIRTWTLALNAKRAAERAAEAE